MYVRKLFALLALLVTAAPVCASDELIRQVRHEFADQLHPLDKLLPGYERPSMTAPTLAIGDFVPDQDALGAWSSIIGEILRWRIQYVPTVHLTMPSAYFTSRDAGTDVSVAHYVLAQPEDRRGLHDALGITTVLTGTLGRSGDEFTIDAVLIDAVSGEQRASKSWRATSEELPAALIGISSWVYDKLGVELGDAERTYLEDSTSITPAAVAAFFKNYVDLGAEELVVRQDLIAELREAHPRFAPFAAYALHSKTYPTNLREARENLELSNQVREAFPLHGGVALESYRTLDLASLPEHETARHLGGLRDLVRANPHDPMMMINLAVAYGDQGDIHEAISLSLEIVERWPDNYRAWWNLGWLVSNRALQLRGETRWSEVSSANQRRFRLLISLSDQSIDKALAMHDGNGSIWATKINGIGVAGGYSPELMAAFEKAVAVAPTYELLYANALNYSQSMWGGNAAARRHIIELAEANNPNAAWPRFMRSRYEADFVGLNSLAETAKNEFDLRRVLENPAFWQLLFGLIALIIGASIYVSVRRARRSMTSTGDDVGSEQGWGEGRVARQELTPEEMLEQVRRRNR